ncbi:hypothetical protein [Flavobacterium cyclinae]|uniref:hypothetical protein n=1 Tax=Flavobacterium cyclinae TaxID=2895947 RepID=UPI001E640095|nr:hypothetical protein [Flavobacterium cyclinae]UGS21138.1 hypothetical protein LOS86_00500 [Flavobacterium cyclinae]
MKLTAKQISYIENYIKSFDIKYYEVYMEILDHMILSVEAILEENNEISFEDAVLKAKVEGFGKKGFKGMMNEKQKQAQIQARKLNNKMIKEYFTFPKIVMTLSVFVGYLLFLECFEDPRKVHAIISTALMFFGFSQYLYFKKFQKIKNFYILKTHMLNFASMLLFPIYQLSNTILIFGKESIDFDHILTRLFMTIVFTFLWISLFVYIEIRKRTIEELKTQIFV